MLRAVVLLALLAVPAASARPSGGTPVVFAVVESANALVPLDGGRSIRVNAPSDVVATYQDFRGALLVVASARAGRVTFADPRARRVLWSLGGFGSPVRVEVVGGIRAYVVDEARGEVDVVDLDLRRIVRRIPVGPRPLNVAFGPRGKMWVAHASGGARDVAVAWDGAAWLAFPDRGELVRVDPSGRRTHIRVRADRVFSDHTSLDRVFAADGTSGRTYLLSARGRVLGRYDGCPGAADVAAVGNADVDVACTRARAVAVYSYGGGPPELAPVGGAPTGVAVAVL